MLPRFYQVIGLLENDVRIVVASHMQPWMWDSLECIGIERSRCEKFAGDRPWKVEMLCYVTPVAAGADHCADAMRWLRSVTLAKLGIQAKPGKRIYLSRKPGAMRTILNEDELLPVLQDRGFQVIWAEDLNFAQQVALFASASHLVGLHGGGLANLVWVPPGCRVLEIFNPDTIDRRCYWSLCHTMGLLHAHLVGQRSCLSNPDAGYILSADLLRQALDGLELLD